jgi:hypothetical protein
MYLKFQSLTLKTYKQAALPSFRHKLGVVHGSGDEDLLSGDK